MIKQLLQTVATFLFPVRSRGTGNIVEIGCRTNRCRVRVSGNNNVIRIDSSCHFSNSEIFLTGDNNVLVIEAGVRLLGPCRIIMEGNAKVRIGRGSGIRGVEILAKSSDIDIGERTMFSRGITVRNHDSHLIFAKGGTEQLNQPRDIIIGDHVWVGQNATILKGVEIGRDSVIAFGSVVTKGCLPNSIVAGNPATVVKENIDWNY